MHQWVRSYGFQRTLSQEAPSGLLAFLVAEIFYKFHSFALECLTFLTTWYVLSWLSSVVRHQIRQRMTKRTPEVDPVL